jgi:hypothetical protein
MNTNSKTMNRDETINDTKNILKTAEMGRETYIDNQCDLSESFI